MAAQDTRFTYSLDSLKEITQNILDHARKAGATACEAEVSQGFGQDVTVRRGAVETIEYNRDKGLGVTVYFGKQRGHASTSDFSPKAVADTVEAALSIARHTAQDEFAGLADEALLAKEIPDLALYHPWDLSVEQAIELAGRCEEAAMKVDERINNSEGASVSTQESLFIYGNSLGFLAGYPSSRQSVSCVVIAESGDGMQRDYWYDSRRDAADLLAIEEIGRRAGERTARRLNARKIDTTQCPVLFEAPLAAGLIGHFVGAISGGALYRKSSFLLDSLGKEIFAPLVNIRELPHIPKGLASSPFDHEGVTTRDRDLVKDGVLNGYMLGSYSARKLGMTSTGNAGGNHNLLVGSTGEDFAGLLKKLGTGLFVTELLGHGVNSVTGDYSRGAAGFWVENGEIAYPVEEVTVAGNLRDMYRNIAAIGTDIEVQGSKQCGSILIESMKVAGN